MMGDGDSAQARTHFPCLEKISTTPFPASSLKINHENIYKAREEGVP
jgi:hypothetical protein